MDTTTTTSNNDNSLNAAMDIDSPSERTPLHGPSPADYGFPNNHRLTQAPSHPSSHRSHSHHQEQRLLRLKIAATTLSFSVLGLFTSSTGALLWSIKRHYDLADRQVSLVFLFVVLGYVSGAQLNAPLHRRLGQRGVAALGPAAHVIAALCAAAHPPFAVLLICVGLGAFGNGALDGTWSSWAGGLDKASTVSGLLHGAFSVGAAVGPTLVGLLISTAEGRWYHWYYVLASLSLLELLSVTYAFRHETAARHAEDLRRAHGSRHGASSSPSSVFSALRHPVVWACAIYLLVYVGFESAITGWVIVFVRAKHHASALLGSLSLSGYWAGMAVGRTALGAAADRYGLRRSVVVYHLVALLFVLLFMIVPTAGLSVAVMVLLGVACGPLFPSAIVYLVSKLPAELHVVSVSTVCSMGQVGGALLPALIGVVADGVGMGAFQGIIFLQLIIVTGCWVVLTKERRSDYVAVRTTEE